MCKGTGNPPQSKTSKLIFDSSPICGWWSLLAFYPFFVRKRPLSQFQAKHETDSFSAAASGSSALTTHWVVIHYFAPKQPFRLFRCSGRLIPQKPSTGCFLRKRTPSRCPYGHPPCRALLRSPLSQIRFADLTALPQAGEPFGAPILSLEVRGSRL